MDVLKSFLTGTVVVKVGDITKETVDAIVNAANGTLMGGGGVDGAIHRAGGPEILKECKEIRRVQYPDGLPTGQAVITTAGRMPAKHVIHTVGPVYGRGGKDKAELLSACYYNSLTLAVDKGLRRLLSRRSRPAYMVIRCMKLRRCRRKRFSNFSVRILCCKRFGWFFSARTMLRPS